MDQRNSQVQQNGQKNGAKRCKKSKQIAQDGPKDPKSKNEPKFGRKFIKNGAKRTKFDQKWSQEEQT